MDRQVLASLQKVSRSFFLDDVEIKALIDISLEVYNGEFLALQGTSGSGKTTLLNVLGLVESFDLGLFMFRGADISLHSEYEKTELRRSSLGYVFQNFNLLSAITAIENVEYPLFLLDRRANKKQIRAKATEILELVGMGSFAKHKPSQLSGGQRQRVAIARALVKNPSLVLADEPTANLDSKNAEQIISLLKTLNEQLSTTIILATHDKQMASAACRHIFLSDGKIISDVRQKNAP